MNLPFSRRRRSLQPRGDAVLRRIDETGSPVSESESASTSTNWPVLGWVAASRQGAQLIAHASPLLSSEPLPLPRSPDDPSAIRLGPGNVEVIAGMRRPDPVSPPKSEVCPRCHFPVPAGHSSDCSSWNFLQPGAFPDD